MSTERTPRIEIYRDLVYPEGNLAETFEARLHEAGEFDAEAVHRTLGPAFRPRVQLASFRELETYRERTKLPNDRDSLELFRLALYQQFSPALHEAISDAPFLPTEIIRVPRGKQNTHLLVAVDDPRLAKERAQVRNTVRTMIQPEGQSYRGIWNHDVQGSRFILARTSREKDRPILNRLNALLLSGELVVPRTVAFEPVYIDVSS